MQKALARPLDRQPARSLQAVRVLLIPTRSEGSQALLVVELMSASATPPSPTRLVQAMYACSVKKADVLRPGIVGMRGSTVIRLRPCMISSTPPPTPPHPHDMRLLLLLRLLTSRFAVCRRSAPLKPKSTTEVVRFPTEIHAGLYFMYDSAKFSQKSTNEHKLTAVFGQFRISCCTCYCFLPAHCTCFVQL